MISFLIDEMFPIAAATLLREQHGLDAVHVGEVGMRGADDSAIAAVARSDGRVIVTENVVDFVKERDVAIVFILKRHLPAGGALAAALADRLARWARDNPDPYVGHHWPS